MWIPDRKAKGATPASRITGTPRAASTTSAADQRRAGQSASCWAITIAVITNAAQLSAGCTTRVSGETSGRPMAQRRPLSKAPSATSVVQ